MKTIYNTYVVMESQQQCDRMKQLCIDNGLHVWRYKNAFEMGLETNCFEFYCGEFFVTYNNILPDTMEDKTQITEQEFIELLKTK